MKKIRNLILRILVLPFILGILLITYNFYAIRRAYLFLIYGGEWINYDDKDKITIKMIYDKLNLEK